MGGKNKAFTLLEVMLTLMIVGSVMVIAVPNYVRLMQISVSDVIYAELTTVRTTVDNCYQSTASFKSCDTKAELGIVTDADINPYSTLTIKANTAVLTETFKNAGRADTCSSVASPAIVEDTPTAGSPVTWTRVFTNTDPVCQQ